MSAAQGSASSEDQFDGADLLKGAFAFISTPNKTPLGPTTPPRESDSAVEASDAPVVSDDAPVASPLAASLPDHARPRLPGDAPRLLTTQWARMAYDGVEKIEVMGKEGQGLQKQKELGYLQVEVGDRIVIQAYERGDSHNRASWYCHGVSERGSGWFPLNCLTGLELASQASEDASEASEDGLQAWYNAD